MKEEDRQLVLDFALKRISESEFLARFPEDPKADPESVKRALEAALMSRHPTEVECAMLLGFRFGFPQDSSQVLCRLLREDWHMQHENIASALQRLKDPRTVDCLYAAALSRFPYLDYDESYALAVKSVWALSAIGTSDAKEKLRLLAQSDNPIIRKNARQRLGAGS